MRAQVRLNGLNDCVLSGVHKMPKPSFFRRCTDFIHRYLGLIAFAQVFLWSLSGMLIASLDFSDLYPVPPVQALPLTPQPLDPAVWQQRLKSHKPKAQLTQLQLYQLADQSVVQLQHTAGAPLLFRADGQVFQLDCPLARKIALLHHQADIKTCEHLPSSSGNYYSNQPIFRIQFADPQGHEIYLSPTTGEVLAHRKRLWGLYNRMWEIHLLKYTASSSLNKALLLIFGLLNAMVALTGLVKFFRYGFTMKKI